MSEQPVHCATYSIGVNFLFVHPIEYLVCFLRFVLGVNMP